MRILIVGVCSTGKSTLEEGLKGLGYDARSCVQEHSYVPGMWRTTAPDLLVYLDAEAATLRRRGETSLDDSSLQEQRTHLADAREHCDLYLRTDRLSREEVLRKVKRFADKRVRR